MPIRSLPPALVLAAMLLPTPAAAQVAGPPPGQAAVTAPANAEALAIYEEGKRAYDAGDYATALRAFKQAAKLEPESARWQYNLGLTLRQLGHLRAARDAFLAAARLDPDYKRVEIAQKLRSMGLDGKGEGRPVNAGEVRETKRGPAVGAAVVGGVVVLLAGAYVILRRRRREPAPASAAIPGPDASILPADPAAIEAEFTRLMRLGTRLVRAEHALRAGEDAELRARLDRATQLEHDARQQLAGVSGGRGLALAAAATGLDEAEAIANEIDALLAGRDAPPTATGRSGCWFCARPLANADYTRIVPLLTAGERVEVLACPPCAARVDRGEIPETLMLGDGSRQQHWSEDPGYDPYLRRHVPPPQAHLLPAWQHQPRRPLPELAKLAAGGALAAGAAFLAARAFADESGPMHGLDLDAARESGLAAEAAKVAAQRSGREGREASLADHS